jgi:hypothetical protein
MTPRLVAGGFGLLLLGGCVYYNGMYNTKRLAGSARVAEREGRTFEATNLWGQVVTRAESLVVRHPDSKYVDEALMLKGTALARLGQCPSAMAPLSRVVQVRGAEDAVEDAYLALGRCHLELGDPAAAELAIANVLDTRQPNRRREARLVHARALRLTGRPAEALAALDSLPGPSAAEERLLALAEAGRRGETARLADSLLTQPDSGRVWDSLVVAVGRADPAAASHIVDRLIGRPGSTPAGRTRWLLEDALRLEATDTARASARLAEAAKAGAGSPAGVSVQVQLARRQLARARSIEDLAPVEQQLDSIAGEAGQSGEAGQLQGSVLQVREAADSSAARATAADLRLFLAAEVARDSLAAPVLAASLFRRVADDWPESAYAPKALFALAMLDPASAESAQALLATRYALSPYVAYTQGTSLPEYQALEDSLQAFASNRGRPAARPTTQPGRTRRPGQPVEPEGQRRRGLEP